MKAWNEIGLAQPQEGAGGDAGALWITSAIDPKKITRSYARNKYWDPAASRPNLKLLTGYRVNEVIFNSAKRAESINIQARGTANGAATLSVKANKEIIITAGWLHTPQVLQRSGVGPAALLQQAGITVVSDLPGVGSNLQDHAYSSISYTCSLFLINSGHLN
jgi:choline dehydrogenase-like flavoprotein